MQLFAIIGVMNRGYDLPDYVTAAVQRETTGKKVRWVGQPDARRVFCWAALIWIFAIPWTVFSLGWESVALAAVFSQKGDGWDGGSFSVFLYIFPIFGLPFVAIGAGMIAAPFWAYFKSRNQAHVVTDDEVITITAKRSGVINVEPVQIATIKKIERNERPNGFGTLTIVTGYGKDSDGDVVERSQKWVGIPDVRKVDQLIAEATKKILTPNAG